MSAMCWPSAETGRHFIAELDAASYRRHPIHGEERVWAETNCYTDLLVELAHGLGFEPAAMLPFTLAIDFEGDQWTFFKPSHADLHDLYGFDVQELALWRPAVEHVAEQLEAGHPVLIELDSFHLPDTAGTAYGRTHTKTTVGVNEIDVGAGRMGYFHNAGYYLLQGADFRAVFHMDGVPHASVLPPYVEFIKWRADFRPPRGGAHVGRSLEILRRHLGRVPRANPFARFKARFSRDLDWLMTADIGRFHAYSFATLRQFGACFELASTYLRWLGAQGIAGTDAPAEELLGIAEGAKALQVQLARSMSRRKPLDLAPLDEMGRQWERALSPVLARFG
jgi:hypothetical protein